MIFNQKDITLIFIIALFYLPEIKVKLALYCESKIHTLEKGAYFVAQLAEGSIYPGNQAQYFDWILRWWVLLQAR